jgi:hypothetical protein
MVLVLLLLPETMKVLQARRLLELKAGLTKNAGWGECLTKWVANSYPCNGPVAAWEGVTCSDDGTVVRVNVDCKDCLASCRPASGASLA